MKRLVLGLVVTMTLAGGAMAKDITADDLAQFKVGEAARADVVHKFGRPMSTTTTSDGSTILVYGSTHGHVKAASFIPVVGLFAGGATGQSTFTVFTFDADGRLKSSTVTSSGVDCSTRITGTNCDMQSASH